MLLHIWDGDHSFLSHGTTRDTFSNLGTGLLGVLLARRLSSLQLQFALLLIDYGHRNLRGLAIVGHSSEEVAEEAADDDRRNEAHRHGAPFGKGGNGR